MRLGALAFIVVAACTTTHAPAAMHARSNDANDTAGSRANQRGNTLSADVVLATIKQRYLAGVERCYARHAKVYGASSGRVIVSFTVDPTGATRDGDAHGVAPRIDGCIRAQVARWRFPAPQSESSFALGLQLAAR